MPQVPAYDQQRVAAAGLPGVQVRSALTPEMATESGRNMSQLGQAMGQIGNAIGTVEREAKAREDEATVKDLYVKTATAVNDVREQFGNQRGLDAGGSVRDGAHKLVDDIITNTRDSIKDENQRRLYDGVTASLRVSSAAQIDSHHYAQMEVAQRAASKAAIDVETNNLVNLRSTFDVKSTDPGQPTQYQLGVMKITALVHDANPGMPQEAVDVMVREVLDNKVHEPAVSRWINEGNIAMARKYLDKQGGLMSAQTVQHLSGAIANAEATDTGYRLWRAGNKPEDVRKMADKGDISVKVHDAFMQRYEHAQVVGRQNHAYAKENLRDQLAAWAYDPENLGKAPSDMPSELRMQAARMGLEGFIPTLQKNIPSEPGVVDRLLGEAAMDPYSFSQRDLSKEEGLSYNDAKRLAAVRQKIVADGGRYAVRDQIQRIAREQAALIPSGISFNVKAGAAIDQRTAMFAGALQGELDRLSVTPDGKRVALTAEQERQAVANVTRKVVDPNSWFNREKPAFMLQAPAEATTPAAKGAYVPNPTAAAIRPADPNARMIYDAYVKRYGVSPTNEVLSAGVSAYNARHEKLINSIPQ